MSIKPLYINGLSGRMLIVPSSTKKMREMLVIGGQHSSIERIQSLAEVLGSYGTVTVPDLPGFGGMESVFKIGAKPDLDTMADYLAAFVKLRYRRNKVSLIGISYGFNVVTKMLQKHPEMSKRVDLVISIVGFVHHDDFKFSPKSLRLMRIGTRLFSFALPAWFAKHVFLRSLFIKLAYGLVADKHVKFKDADSDERKKRINFEIQLWKSNDIRTYMYSIHEMLSIDLCNSQIGLPIHHVSVAGDQYFDNYKVEQHMRVIYTDFLNHSADLGAHMPTIIVSAEEIAPLIPPSLRKQLSKSV